MFTIDYSFQPGNTVFVVIEDTRIESGTIVNVKFKVYEEDEAIVTKVIYKVASLDEDEGTVDVESTVVFLTTDEAADYVSNFLTPTPTATLTPTVTPTVTPTPSTP